MNDPSPALIRVSPCSVLRLGGPDRKRFLNGQVTQDVRLASESRAVFSAVLNAKGKLDAVCYIRECDDAYLLDAPLDLRESLFARLDRYIIADDVELTDESDRWHLVHIVGEGTEAPAGRVYSSTRLATEGHDVVSEGPIDPGLLPTLDAAATEGLRIEAGVPRWGHELTPGLLPPEAGLDRTAISYEKGCYLGQEVISRMKRAGKTNQHLVRLRVPTGTPTPSLLTIDGRSAGRITSVAPGSTGGTSAALGFRSRKFGSHSTFGMAGEDGQILPGEAVVAADS